MNKVIFALLFVNNLFGATINNPDSITYQETIKSLSFYSKNNKTIEKKIVSNIVYLVFEAPNTNISIEKKCDLVLLIQLADLQTYNIICNQFKLESNVNNSKGNLSPLIVALFSNCRFQIDLMSELESYYSNNRLMLDSTLGIEYAHFYFFLNKKIENAITSNAGLPIEYSDLLFSMKGFLERKYYKPTDRD